MSGTPDEHASYCAICDVPIPDAWAGATCDECAGQVSDEDLMDAKERADFAFMQIENGNLLDGIDCIMRDGDVRVDSVVAALLLTQLLVEHQVRPVGGVVDMLVRIIERWEIAP